MNQIVIENLKRAAGAEDIRIVSNQAFSMKRLSTRMSIQKTDKITHISEEEVSDIFPKKEKACSFSKEVVKKIANYLTLNTDGALTYRSGTMGS